MMTKRKVFWISVCLLFCLNLALHKSLVRSLEFLTSDIGLLGLGIVVTAFLLTGEKRAASKRIAFAKYLFIFKLIPWLFVALFGCEIVAVMMPKKDGEYHVREFGRLPVLLNGRIQPFDSVARNSLLQIPSTADVPLEVVPSWQFWHHPKKLKSSEWLLEVMTRPEVADTRPVFLIHHAELLGELKLQDKGIDKSGLRYYTFNDLKPLLSEINEQARKAGDVKSEDQTTFQKQVGKLANALSLYQRLKVTFQPEGVEDFAQALADFQKNIGPAQLAAQASESGKPFDKDALQRIAGPVEEFQLMARFGYPLTVPPRTSSQARDHWQSMGASLLESGARRGLPSPRTPNPR